MGRRLHLRHAVIAVGLGLVLALGGAFVLERRSLFLPGTTSAGHHLLETQCGACHVAFASVPNERCAGCHKPELEDDVHPVRMFDDPRWAATLEKVDALRCVTCHREHVVTAGGATVDRRFCFPCHDDVVDKRASHRALAPESCGEAGCHNYHDNTALNVAFLKKRRGDPELLPRPALAEWAREAARPPRPPLPDHPATVAAAASLVADWQGSAHAASGVSCMKCHQGGGGFVAKPTPDACRTCHAFEVTSFHAGTHGARTSLGLSPATPGMARLPMKAFRVAAPAHSCATCHDPHRLDTRRAAVEACLGCHDDTHSRRFGASPHATTAAQDPEAVRVAPGAVTCATCHLPRMRVQTDEGMRVLVNHNNSYTARPRDRMAKVVCTACHGFPFALAAVLDDGLVATNFRGRPVKRHDTFKMIDALVAEDKDDRSAPGGVKP